MSNVSWSSPLPVVGVGDDAAGEFRVSSAVASVRKDTIELLFAGLAITNAEVERLVLRGGAAAVAKLTCEATFFRRTTKLSADGRVSVGTHLVVEELRAELNVVATERLSRYRPSGLHQDYGEAAFEVEEGDVLARGPECRFHLDLSFDPLRAPVGSIMRVRRVMEEYPGYRVNFHSQRIVVEFGPSEWARYQRLKNGMAPAVLHSSVVLPVLTEAICLVKAGAVEVEEELWFRRLKVMIDALSGVTYSQPASQIAQALLKDPFSRAALQLIREPDES